LEKTPMLCKIMTILGAIFLLMGLALVGYAAFELLSMSGLGSDVGLTR